MIRALSAAAVLHRSPRLLIEDDTEKENERTLELHKTNREKISRTTRDGSFQRWKESAHLHTVEACKQVVEDDHVAVDGQKSQKTRDGNQEEDAARGLQAGAAGERSETS